MSSPFSSGLVIRKQWLSEIHITAATSLYIFLVVYVFSIRELPFLNNNWTATRFERVFLCLVVFEMACGVYTPAMEALQVNREALSL